MAKPLPVEPRLQGEWLNRTTWAVGLGLTVSMSAQAGSSWILDALVSSGSYSVAQASFFVTAEMLAMATAMLLLSPIITRVPVRRLILVAWLVTLGAQGWSALANDALTMGSSRVLSGLALGCIYSATAATGARSKCPERTFAAAGSLMLVIGITFNPLLGTASAAFGHSGIFAGLLIYCLACGAPLVWLQPALNPVAAEDPARASNEISWSRAAAVMLIIGLFAAATSGALLFSVQIAASLGLSGGELGSWLSVVSLIGASGGFLANRLGERFGLLAPLLAGLAATGGSLLWLTLSTSLAFFWTSLTLSVAAFWFTYPYILGFASRIDPAGRVASATGSSKLLFSAGGTALAGVIVQLTSVPGAGVMAFVLCVAAGVVALLAFRDRQMAGRSRPVGEEASAPQASK